MNSFVREKIIASKHNPDRSSTEQTVDCTENFKLIYIMQSEYTCTYISVESHPMKTE